MLKHYETQDVNKYLGHLLAGLVYTWCFPGTSDSCVLMCFELMVQEGLEMYQWLVIYWLFCLSFLLLGRWLRPQVYLLMGLQVLVQAVHHQLSFPRPLCLLLLKQTLRERNSRFSAVISFRRELKGIPNQFCISLPHLLFLHPWSICLKYVGS